MRPTWSPGLLVQMAGRGCRKAEGKTDCLVLDFGGNIRRHGPLDLISGSAGGRLGEKTGVAPTRVCPACDSIVPPSAMNCPDCGHAWPSRQPKHGARADAISPMSGEQVWITVRSIGFYRHVKWDGSGPPSLRIEYSSDNGDCYREWLPFEAAKGRFIAARKWRELGGAAPTPATVEEALGRTDEIEGVAQIAVRHDGKFWSVIAHRRRHMMEANDAA